MKRNTILLSSVFLILLLLIILFLMYSNWSYRNKIRQCPYIDTSSYGKDIFFEDCLGVISIERRTSGEEFYLIQDDKHKYTIENVGTTKQYKLSDTNLYIYRVPNSKFQTLLGNDKIFYEKLFIDGELKTIEYDSYEKIPAFMKVDVNSGEVVLFNDYNEMPGIDKGIFEKLANENKDL